MQMECNDAIIAPFKYTHAHVPRTRHGYNKALPVNFTANYQEGMTHEPNEANSQHFPEVYIAAQLLHKCVFFSVLNLQVPR